MKNKASLLLMELLIMILVFALAAAVCLRGFAYAAKTSREIVLQEEAVFLAQSAVEQLKASREIPESTLFYSKDLTPVKEENAWCYYVKIEAIPTDIPGFGQAQVQVGTEDSPRLATLTVGWQEGT